MRTCLLVLCLGGMAFGNEGFSGMSLGVAGRDFVVLAADATFRRGTLSFRAEREAVSTLTRGLLMSCVGDVGEAEDFSSFVGQNLVQYEFLAGSPASTTTAVHFVRRELAERRRTRGAMPKLRLLMGGVAGGEASLYWLDETGASTRLPFGAHGVGSPLVLGHLDRAYDPDLSRDEAVELVTHCLDILQQRYALNLDAATIKVLSEGDCESLAWRRPGDAPGPAH